MSGVKGMKKGVRKPIEQRREENRLHMRCYMAGNREAYNARQRRYYAENKEKWSDYNGGYVERIGRDTHNERQRANYAKHAETRREAKRLKRAEDPEKFRRYSRERRLADRETINAKAREYYAKKIEHRRATGLAHWHARRAQKRQRTLIADDLQSIRQIFLDRPVGCHVDHVVPLTGFTPDGDRVCGLHVSWNLQYLPGEENLAKKSRMTNDDLVFALIPNPIRHDSLKK